MLHAVAIGVCIISFLVMCGCAVMTLRRALPAEVAVAKMQRRRDTRVSKDDEAKRRN